MKRQSLIATSLTIVVTLALYWVESGESSRAVWLSRLLLLTTAVMGWIATFLAFLRSRRGASLTQHFPVEPLEVGVLLKSLQSQSPHKIWQGTWGEMWAMSFRGAGEVFPKSHFGQEIWFYLIEGDEVQVDARSKPVALQEGQWVRLPHGLGKTGLRSTGASQIVWFLGR